MLEDKETQSNNNQNNSVLEFKIACPKCGIVFFVPVELGGEMAECSECGGVFQIPVYDEKKDFETTETGTIKGIDEAGDSHSTVRLSRTSIGMIPTLKDEFEIGSRSLPPRDD